MILDLVFAVIVVIAIVKGFQRGLIVGIFSFVAIVIGLAAAIKLSVVVADRLGSSVNVSRQWLPILAFIIVFIIVVVLVRFGAKLIQRTVELSMLGWLNRLGGILLYLVIYISVWSVLLFYIEKMNLLKQDTINNSSTYSFVKPWGPFIIDAFGRIIPVFKNMFTELENFFARISHKL